MLVCTAVSPPQIKFCPLIYLSGELGDSISNQTTIGSRSILFFDKLPSYLCKTANTLMKCFHMLILLIFASRTGAVFHQRKGRARVIEQWTLPINAAPSLSRYHPATPHEEHEIFPSPSEIASHRILDPMQARLWPSVHQRESSSSADAQGGQSGTQQARKEGVWRVVSPTDSAATKDVFVGTEADEETPDNHATYADSREDIGSSGSVPENNKAKQKKKTRSTNVFSSQRKKFVRDSMWKFLLEGLPTAGAGDTLATNPDFGYIETILRKIVDGRELLTGHERNFLWLMFGSSPAVESETMKIARKFDMVTSKIAGVLYDLASGHAWQPGYMALPSTLESDWLRDGPSSVGSTRSHSHTSPDSKAHGHSPSPSLSPPPSPSPQHLVKRTNTPDPSC